jgi:hypothetical protein
MKPEIASLHERMAQGGNWRAFRDEIAALHSEATTEEEYVTLLEAHKKLVAVGKFAFDEKPWAEIRTIAEKEYRFLLLREAVEGEAGLINPVLLERVTRREVEAGRLDPDDPFRTDAVAGAHILGDSAELTAHRCNQGSWFFYGIVAAAILSAVLARVSLSPLWVIALGLFVGWLLNDRERKRIKEEISARRSRGT